MLHRKSLILKLLAIDRLATRTIPSCEVTSLDHEPDKDNRFNEALEERTLTLTL